MDHGRRARLLGAREERRRDGALPDPRPAVGLLRLRLPARDRARVAPVRRGAERVLGREGDQLGRDVPRRGARVLPRPARALAVALARGGGARGRGALDGLHGHADDGERVLPDLPRRGARARADAGEADLAAAATRARDRARGVRDARAGGGAVPRDPDRPAPARVARPSALQSAVRDGGRGRGRRGRRRGAARALSAGGARRLPDDEPRALPPRRRVPVGALAPGGPRPLPRRDPVRRVLRPLPRVAAARRAAARVHGRDRDARALALARGLGVRLDPDGAADRGAEPLLRRAVLPDRAAALDPARLAAAAAVGDRRRARLGRARRGDSRSSGSSGSPRPPTPSRCCRGGSCRRA